MGAKGRAGPEGRDAVGAASVTDRELLEGGITRGLVHHPDVPDIFAQPTADRPDERVDLCRLPLGDQLHPAVVEVADVAPYLIILRQLLTREAESDALDMARVIKSSTHVGHRSRLATSPRRQPPGAVR